MFSALVLAVALTGQAPPPAAQAAPRTPSVMKPRVAPRPAARVAQTADEKARLIAKRKAKKGAAYVARVNREAAEAQAQALAAAKAQKEAKELLPYQIELNRQALNRQSDIERNAALNRAVSAMERSAGYIYPGQSPTRGPY